MWPLPSSSSGGFTTTNIDSALLLRSEYEPFVLRMRRECQAVFSCPMAVNLNERKKALPRHRPSMTLAKPTFRLLAP
jgi:hypothetical protein